MTASTRSHRRRTILLAVILGWTTFAVEAVPTSIPLPRPEALTPEPVAALGCADGPSFQGRLTSSKTSTAAVTRSTTGNVYGYISNVIDDWSCTNAFRYDGLGYRRLDADGNFDWGNLINSISVSCNWVLGSTDYLKGNSTTDCPDSDAEYALPIHFDKTSAGELLETIAHQDVNHDDPGDFFFIHSDCTSYYGGESIRYNQAFGASEVNNRPGDNCDPLDIDGTNTSQTIVLDATPPTRSFTAPVGAAGTVTGFNAAGNPYQVKFTVTDIVAKFDATHQWQLQRVVGSAANGVCSAMSDDLTGGSVVTGTAETLQTSNQTLTVPACYRWKLSATDANGNAATTLTSADVITDVTAPAVAFTSPSGGATISRNTTAFTVSWTESDAHSGVTTRSLQRQRVAATSAACPGTFTNDGSAVTTASPSSQTLTSGYCYQWLQTVTDRAGLQTVATSGRVYVDTTIPMGDYNSPNEGTNTIQSSTSYTRSWTETAGTGTITARSTQRQKGTVITPGSCADVTWADDGAPSTLGSAVTTSPLASNRCFRWVLTLTNSAGKTGVTTSGSVLIDATAPAGTIAFPETNRVLAGDVVVTGTATDAGSFQDYQLEYGAGVSPGSWTSIGTWTSPVGTTGPLGTWPTGTLSGAYTLRLTVRDVAANTASVTTRLVYLENARRGDEAFQTRVSFDLGGGYTLDVGVANGEARLSRDLFSIPSFGPSQALSLSYSSLETGTAGKFGYGWSSNLTQYLTFESGFNMWHRADGGRVPFGSVATVWTPLRGHYETMSVSGGEVTITTKDQMKYVFEDSGAGRLKRITNRFGKSLTIAWTTSAATVTDATTPTGRVTNIVLDAGNNRITSVTDSAGRAWTFGYTGTGTNSDLTTITDPASKVTTLAYSSHALTTVTRSRSRVSGAAESIVWAVAYASGKVSTVTDPIDAAGTPRRNKFTYNTGSTTVEILKAYSPETALWNTTTYAYDSLGRVVTERLVAAALPEAPAIDYTTTYGYDADSNLLTLDTPVGDGASTARTTFTYDAKGNVLAEIVPIDASTSVKTVNSYNATNDLLTRTEADLDSAIRMVTRYVYDGAGHLTSVNVNCTTTGTTPPSTGSSCTGAGTQDSATNLITNFAYTATDQLEFEQDPLGRITKHVYDTWGNETSTYRNCTTTGTTPPATFNTCTAGGTADHQTNVRTQATYDQATVAGKAGLATKTTDAMTPARDTLYTYDALGRQLTAVLPGDTTIPVLTRTTTYDELGNVLTDTDGWTPLGGGGAVSSQTIHVYDLVNREKSTTDPAGVTTSAVFDAAGNAVSTTSGGVTSSAIFDALGRVVQETTVDGNTTHTYDAQGNEIGTASPGPVISARTFTWTGWLLDEITDPTTLALTVSHTYDTLGRELTVTDQYDPAVGAPAPVVTTMTYDRIGRQLTSTTATAISTTVYDRNGNVLSVRNPDGDVSATIVDPLDRTVTSIANCTNTGTTQPAAGVVCTGTGTLDAVTNLTTKTFYDANGTAIAMTDPKGISSRTISNVRDLARESIANCTDTGTLPTTNPRACVGQPPAATQDTVTNIHTTMTYDGQGAAVTTIVAVGVAGNATSYTTFDAAGRVQATMDPRGTVTRTIYDANGRVQSTVVNCTEDTASPQPPPLLSSWWTCDGSTLKDGTWNVITSFTYDSHGNQATVTAPNGRVTKSLYDDDERLITRIENFVDGIASGSTLEDLITTYAYDEAGRQSGIRAPTATATTYAVTQFVYDANGRLSAEIRNCTDTGTTVPLVPGTCTGAGTADFQTNLSTTYAYDERGNRIRMTMPDPAATSGTATTTVTTQYAYDIADRLCRVVENATGGTDLQALPTPCSSNTQGTPTATANVSTRYTYDDAGRLVSMIDA